MRTLFMLAIGCLLGGLLGAGCGGDPGGPGREARPRRAKPLVYTTFYPTTYFTRRIAGDLAEVVCPLPGDADPIFWMPPSEAIRAYQEADLIVVNGAGYEKWVERVSLPMARTVNSARSFRNEFLRFESAVTHSHGKGGEHSHEGIDGHTWLDPRLAVRQAEAIRAALVLRLPEREEQLTARFAELKRDLEGLGEELMALGPMPEGEWIYASHPAYNYPANRYGWRVVNPDLDPGQMPGPAVLASVGETLDAKPGRYLLWESEPLPEIAKRVESVLGFKSILFSPCETKPGEGDYVEAMKASIARLKPAFRPAH